MPPPPPVTTTTLPVNRSMVSPPVQRVAGVSLDLHLRQYIDLS
jgi:hypothetical protein